MLELIHTEKSAAPAGHYSQAVVHNGLVYLAGQVPKTLQGNRVEGGIEAQTRQVLENVKAVLEAANSQLSNVIRVTVYVTDMKYWAEVNQVYAEYFADHKPARTVVPTRELNNGYLVEIDLIAAQNQ